MPTPSVIGIGIANLPNQRHRIVTKKGTNFSLIVVGESGLGKSTFINTLFTTSLLPKKTHVPTNKTVEIKVYRAELEENGFRTLLTVIDTPGFGDNVNNDQSWKPIVDYVDAQHDASLSRERKAERFGSEDTRVHACIYFISPSGHGLKSLDIEALKALSTRVNVIPVIAKADTITPKAMSNFKETIRRQLAEHQIQVYSCPTESLDEETAKRNKEIMSAMPFSIIGSETDVEVGGKLVKGRKYLWGTVEVENEQHCDFKKLRNLLIRAHLSDLILSTEINHYEQYRFRKLESGGYGGPGVNKKLIELEAKLKEEEDLLRKKFTEQVRQEEARFRQWEEKLLQDSEKYGKDLDKANQELSALKEEVESLQMQGKKK